MRTGEEARLFRIPAADGTAVSSRRAHREDSLKGELKGVGGGDGEPGAAAADAGAAEAGGAEGAGGVLPHAEPPPRAPALRRGAGGLAGGALPQRSVRGRGGFAIAASASPRISPPDLV